jgi:hypothetical protein
MIMGKSPVRLEKVYLNSRTGCLTLCSPLSTDKVVPTVRHITKKGSLRHKTKPARFHLQVEAIYTHVFLALNRSATEQCLFFKITTMLDAVLPAYTFASSVKQYRLIFAKVNVPPT